MTKRERIQAAVKGTKPDKLPYSLWTHLPGIDLDPALLAEKTYEGILFDGPEYGR